MTHVLVVGRIHKSGLAVLEQGGASYEMLDAPTEAETVQKTAGADAILVRTAPISAATIAAGNRLRVVSRHGVGYDNIDVAAASRRGIPVTVVGDVNAVPVAEHTLMLILALAKRTVPYDKATRENRWAIRDSFGGTELSGKTLLLLGFGRIGREVARRAKAFDMQVMAYDPYVTAQQAEALGVRHAPDLKKALPQADFVSVHLPLTEETRGMLGGDAIEEMKPTACIICTARGGIVDEPALVKALAVGRIHGAGLDVYLVEPPPADDPLFKLDGVVLSPHCAALTEECAIRMAEISAQNCLDAIAGRLRPELVVNRAALG
jgi:D-3-phosphoglycerate dehydrogenase